MRFRLGRAPRTAIILAVALALTTGILFLSERPFVERLLLLASLGTIAYGAFLLSRPFWEKLKTHPEWLHLLSLFTEWLLYFVCSWTVVAPQMRKALALHLATVALACSRMPKNNLVRVTGGIFFVALLFAVGWLADYEKMFGPPDYDSFSGFLQADQGEILSYFSEVLSIRTVLLTCVFLSCFLFLPRLRNLRQLPAFNLKPGAGWLAAGVYVMVTVLTWAPLKTRWNEYSRSLRRLAEESRTYRQLAATLPKTLVKRGLAGAAYEGDLIVVIAESLSARHLSLLGYHRQTTPELERWRKKLYIHEDAISPHSHTVPSLTGALTPATAATGLKLEGHFSDNLVTEFRRASLHTTWLSNQNELGVYENPITLIARQADVSRFVRPSFGRQYRAGYYDERLLPHLKEALSHPHKAQAIFLHLYASHAPYCQNIPEAFRHRLPVTEGLGEKFFGASTDRSESVNCYDNAVAYLDSLFGSILSLADTRSRPTSVLIFSDHGEAAVYGTGHNASQHSAYQVQVPVLWFFNRAARTRHQQEITTLQTTRGKAFSTEDLYDSLLHLVGSEQADRSRSVFSLDYTTRPRITIPSPTGTQVAYDDPEAPAGKDRLEISRNELLQLKAHHPSLYPRTWAHRVNTLGKLLEAKQLFSGVELDIVYHADSDDFSVAHPPARDLELSLSAYFSAASDRPLHFWLDWKNPDLSTLQKARARLLVLLKKFGLQKRALIETPPHTPSIDLSELRGAGVIHSYYLPTSEILSCRAQPSLSRCRVLAQTLSKTAIALGVQAVSFDARARAFVNAYPSQFSRFQWLSWNTVLKTSDNRFAETWGAYHQAVRPAGNEIFLVSFPSAFEW